MIIIQITSKVEWKETKSLLDPIEINAYPYGEYVKTIIDNLECIFYHGGPTKTLASGACQYAIDRWAPEILFVLGTCGGVAEDLQPFDVILAEKTAQWDVDPARKKVNIFHEMIALDNSWTNWDDFPYKIVKGFIASGDQTVTASNCDRLRNGEVTAADWETASIAKICSVNDVKCCIVRGVSDLGSEREFNFEIFQRNTFIIMEMLIKSYLPPLVSCYMKSKSNPNPIVPRSVE
jgi:nucleoside phosphorylase